MSYAVMPLTDYKDMCDKVREKIPVNLLENATFEEREINEEYHDIFLCSSPFHLEDDKEYTINFPNATASNNFIYIAGADWNTSNYIPASILDTEFPYSFIPIDLCNPTPESREYRIFIYKPDSANYIDTTDVSLTKADTTIKSGEMPSKIEEVYEAGTEAGKKAEWNRFWDLYQDYGNRKYYGYAFSGVGWAENGMLPPKYPIVLSAGSTTEYGIFVNFNRYGENPYDMTEVCKILNCSKAKRLTQMFKDASVENITIDMSNCEVATDMFACTNGGGNIDKVYLKVTEKLTTVTSMFSNCMVLETLRFTEDSVINVAISFVHSSRLSSESVDSIISALKDRTGSTALKLTVHEDVYNRMVANGQDVLVTAKNWTLVSA